MYTVIQDLGELLPFHIMVYLGMYISTTHGSESTSINTYITILQTTV